MQRTLYPMTEPTKPQAVPSGYPGVFQTAKGVYFLKEAHVAMLSSPSVELSPVVEEFLPGFEPELNFGSYQDDEWMADQGSLLAKFAGQLCYLSFSPRRTWNKDLDKYLLHILESGHGSVLEHINYSFLFWGIDRGVTHEIVRHRAGFGFSQVSQRYCNGSTLRFVMRPEYQENPRLESLFYDWIEAAFQHYEKRAEVLAEMIRPTFGGSATDLRKKINQAARGCLPNETEAPILITANARAWRHFIAMRGSQFADEPIRRVAVKVAKILADECPPVLQDMTIGTLPDYGECVSFRYPKV